MSTAYDMHANWREINPREVLDKCRKHGGTITPYARDRGLRSYIISWPSEGCEGHLYVLRVKPLQRLRMRSGEVQSAAFLRGREACA